MKRESDELRGQNPALILLIYDVPFTIFNLQFLATFPVNDNHVRLTDGPVDRMRNERVFSFHCVGWKAGAFFKKK